MLTKINIKSYLLYFLILILTGLGFYVWGSLFCTKPIFPAGKTMSVPQFSSLFIISWTGMTLLLAVNAWFTSSKLDNIIKIGLGIAFLFIFYILFAFRYDDIYRSTNILEANIGKTYFISSMLDLIPYLIISTLLVKTKSIDWKANLALVLVFNFFILFFDLFISNNVSFFSPEMFLCASIAGAFSFAYGYHHNKKHHIIFIVSIIITCMILYLLANVFISKYISMFSILLLMRFVYPILLSLFTGWLLQSKSEVGQK